MQLGEQRAASLSLPEDHPYNKLPILANFPAPFKPVWFQKQLEKIGGKEVNGKPRFRLVWGQDPENMEWDCYGREWRAKYIYSCVILPVTSGVTDTGLVEVKHEKFDIGWPRWWVEYYIPPEHTCRGHVVSGIDDDGASFVDPLPTEGLYFPQLEINEHDEACCRLAASQSMDCHGYYRDPGNPDLEIIRQLIKARDAQKEDRSGTKTQKDHEQVAKEHKEKLLQWREGLKERFGRIAKDAVLTHAPMFSSDPTVVKWGKYHWTSGHSKSGTPFTSKDSYGDNKDD